MNNNALGPAPGTAQERLASVVQSAVDNGDLSLTSGQVLVVNLIRALAAPSGPCVVKGPYYPIGDVDWMCRTHDVLAEPVDGGWQCPITKQVRVSPAGVPADRVLRLPGIDPVPVTIDPSLDRRGRIDWHPARITLREPDPTVLLHEVLHLLVATYQRDGAHTLYPDHAEHHPLVWHLTRGLAAHLGWEVPESGDFDGDDFAPDGVPADRARDEDDGPLVACRCAHRPDLYLGVCEVCVVPYPCPPAIARDEDARHLRTLSKAATPGPWKARRFHSDNCPEGCDDPLCFWFLVVSASHGLVGTSDTQPGEPFYVERDGPRGEADAALIVALVNRFRAALDAQDEEIEHG